MLLNFFDDRYVGRLFVKGSGKPLEILTKLNEMAGFAPDQEIELYEASHLHFVCSPTLFCFLRDQNLVSVNISLLFSFRK